MMAVIEGGIKFGKDVSSEDREKLMVHLGFTPMKKKVVKE